ncbi:MAG: hypothetical protein WAP03_21830 [Methylorubrum rhodinum]|uniref:hypothetical protein n=1 Tax=Methylorubrum rhodinum TaxID=29428 RepID=UPI003BB21D90
MGTDDSDATLSNVAMQAAVRALVRNLIATGALERREYELALRDSVADLVGEGERAENVESRALLLIFR